MAKRYGNAQSQFQTKRRNKISWDSDSSLMFEHWYVLRILLPQKIDDLAIVSMPFWSLTDSIMQPKQ